MKVGAREREREEGGELMEVGTDEMGWRKKEGKQFSASLFHSEVHHVFTCSRIFVALYVCTVHRKRKGRKARPLRFP